MASNTINQGAVNGIVIKPIWGTLDKQEEDSVDRFIAIVDSIKKLLDSKADIDHNHNDRYYTKTEIDTKLLAIDTDISQIDIKLLAIDGDISQIDTKLLEIDGDISQINSKLTPMYGYCETASANVAKTVTITNFTLVTGRTVYIKFEHENSAEDPTLNISGTGAIRIVRYGTDPVSEQEIQWSDGEVKCFTYDGTSWIESGGAGGGSDRSDTISFHGSDMIVEPGTNRITFDDSDMIIHPPDGAAWLERTMEAIESGIAIISTNNEHAAISNGQYVYIRMHETLPDGLYKATTDIAQNAELSDLNVESASGALNDKSDVGHDHDDRYYTESEIDTALAGKVSKSGDTMTGTLVLQPSIGEGGQIELRAASNDNTSNQIILDHYSGIFRVFGNPSRDGTTKTGVGTSFQVNPYTAEFGAGYTYKGHSLNTINLGTISNLNISTRTEGKIHIGSYTPSATNIPVSGKGGTTLLFVNAGTVNYGIQLAFTDNATGIYKRLLDNNAYGAWSAA